MKDLKTLKRFKEEGMSLNSSEQSAILGGKYAVTSRLSATSGGSQGDCIRYAKEDNPNYQTAENSQYYGVVVAGVSAVDCHF